MIITTIIRTEPVGFNKTYFDVIKRPFHFHFHFEIFSAFFVTFNKFMIRILSQFYCLIKYVFVVLTKKFF